MAATDESEIWNFEGNIESAFIAWLLSKGLDGNSSNEIEVLPEDFFTVQADVGGVHNGVNGHMTTRANGKSEFDEYDFELAIKIQTLRGEETPSSVAGINRRHQEVVAKIRQWTAISNAKDSALEGNLTLYALKQFVPSGTTRDSVNDDYDETTLNFAGKFVILTTAWPS